MMRYLTILFSFLIAACSYTTPQMQFCDYAAVEVGTSITEVQGCWGPCIEHHSCCDKENTEQYVYIERFETYPGYEEHHRYIFNVREGVIVEKAYEHYNAPFRFNRAPKAQPHAGYRHGS